MLGCIPLAPFGGRLVSSLSCRWCAAPLPGGGRCPYCGAANSGGPGNTTAGVLTAGTLFAALAAGAYGWLLSPVWARWVGKFDRLPEADPLHGRGVELASAWTISIAQSASVSVSALGTSTAGFTSSVKP